jgi:type IV pilus assembly protein PilN
MIRINLLPVRGSKKREFGRQQLILLGLISVLAVIGNFFWYQQVQKDLTTVEAQIANTKTQIAQLEKTIGEVKSISQEKKALEDKLKILDSLKKGRTGPVKVMDELATLIPSKVWILDYTETNGVVSFRGSAVTYEDLSAFSKKLKGSKHFKDISIRRANQRADGVVDWEISCNADYSA